MDFVKELWEANDAETFHVWNELLMNIDDEAPPNKKLGSFFFDKSFDKAILAIARLIDECYTDDRTWEHYAMDELFKHHRFDVYPIQDTSTNGPFKISFEVLFHAVCYLASRARVDDRITPDVVRAYGEKLVLRYDEFENAVLELIREQCNGKEYDELQRMIMPALVPDDIPNSLSENEYSDDY